MRLTVAGGAAGTDGAVKFGAVVCELAADPPPPEPHAVTKYNTKHNINGFTLPARGFGDRIRDRTTCIDI